MLELNYERKRKLKKGCENSFRIIIIYAAWCRVCSSEKNNFHVHCPIGRKCWCTYQSDIANGTKTHVSGKGLPENVKHVKEVFDELSDDNLLMKCLHGETPNRNEAFNGTKWNRIPIS